MINLEKKQMEFSDLKPELPELEFEKIDCQDVGPCQCCNRGKIESAEIVKLNKAKSKKAA